MSMKYHYRTQYLLVLDLNYFSYFIKIIVNGFTWDVFLRRFSRFFVIVTSRYWTQQKRHFYGRYWNGCFNRDSGFIFGK
jgi:hypothetical protein